MKILAIDTSTDETSVAVTEGTRVLSNTISTQIRYHKKFGGVVPMLAARLHAERIQHVITESLHRAKLEVTDIDAIAVTYGPGLAPALQVGINAAKELAGQLGKPLYGINHMTGHIASCFAQVGTREQVEPSYPFLAILVSGGHSELVLVESFRTYTILGQTLDDALGEAYDKVGRMLGLGYPAGKLIAKLAEEGNPKAFPLPVAMLRSGDFNLSYSGLKNAVRLLVDDLKLNNRLDKQAIMDVCASFQFVAQQSLLRKTDKVLQVYPEIQQVILAGGVAANTVLRAEIRRLVKNYNLPLITPVNLKLCTDNAAMIGVAAYFGIAEGLQPVEPKVLDRIPHLSLEDE